MQEIKKDRHRKSTRSRQGQIGAQRNYRLTQLKTKFSTNQKSTGKRGRSTGNVKNTRNTTEVGGKHNRRADKERGLKYTETDHNHKNGQDVT